MSIYFIKRAKKIGRKRLEGKSFDDIELQSNPDLIIDYIIATPRMADYILRY
jgi:DNA polymerase V